MIGLVFSLLTHPLPETMATFSPVHPLHSDVKHRILIGTIDLINAGEAVTFCFSKECKTANNHIV
jgi:hypothetical protein